MNFQNIRDDFNKQIKEQAQAIETEQMRQHLTEELDRQDKLHARSRSENLRHEIWETTGKLI